LIDFLGVQSGRGGTRYAIALEWSLGRIVRLEHPKKLVGWGEFAENETWLLLIDRRYLQRRFGICWANLALFA
jgi:hypothetical protein